MGIFLKGIGYLSVMMLEGGAGAGTATIHPLTEEQKKAIMLSVSQEIMSVKTFHYLFINGASEVFNKILSPRNTRINDVFSSGIYSETGYLGVLKGMLKAFAAMADADEKAQLKEIIDKINTAQTKARKACNLDKKIDFASLSAEAVKIIRDSEPFIRNDLKEQFESHIKKFTQEIAGIQSIESFDGSPLNHYIAKEMSKVSKNGKNEVNTNVLQIIQEALPPFDQTSITSLFSYLGNNLVSFKSCVARIMGDVYDKDSQPTDTQTRSLKQFISILTMIASAKKDAVQAGDIALTKQIDTLVNNLGEYNLEIISAFLYLLHSPIIKDEKNTDKLGRIMQNFQQGVHGAALADYAALSEDDRKFVDAAALPSNDLFKKSSQDKFRYFANLSKNPMVARVLIKSLGGIDKVKKNTKQFNEMFERVQKIADAHDLVENTKNMKNPRAPSITIANSRLYNAQKADPQAAKFFAIMQSIERIEDSDHRQLCLHAFGSLGNLFNSKTGKLKLMEQIVANPAVFVTFVSEETTDGASPQDYITAALDNQESRELLSKSIALVIQNMQTAEPPVTVSSLNRKANQLRKDITAAPTAPTAAAEAAPTTRPTDFGRLINFLLSRYTGPNDAKKASAFKTNYTLKSGTGITAVQTNGTNPKIGTILNLAVFVANIFTSIENWWRNLRPRNSQAR